MDPWQSVRATARTHPDALEVAAGGAGALVVLAVALLQFGFSPEGWARGVTLGALVGAVVAITYRRRRTIDERRRAELARQRLQLARELHDAVSGQVAIIGIQAAAARRVLTSHPEAAATALEQIEVAGRAAIADLRSMVAALRGDDGAEGTRAIGAREPGLADLPALLTEMGAAGLRIETRIDPAVGTSLAASTDHAAYRIIQEGLTNALRHAGPVAVSVTVAQRAGWLDLAVCNERATGASAQQGGGGLGLGLVGMRERAALFGGELRARPTADGGYLLQATLPIAPMDRP